MKLFPEFLRDRSNLVATRDRSDGVEGYVFDGTNGAQVIFFECTESGVSKEHVHSFDEYFVVIQGEYTLGIQGRTLILRAGQEYYIPAGVAHDGRFTAGTRTMNAFGGRRADRKHSVETSHR